MPKSSNCDKSDSLRDILKDDCDGDVSYDDRQYKKKKTNNCYCVKEEKRQKRANCKGNDCCGCAACVLASTDSCDAPCVNEAQNILILTKRFIATPQTGTPAGSPVNLTYPVLNFYVRLPESCSTGPITVVWATANTILNLFQAANLATVLTAGSTANFQVKLNVLSCKPVFDPAKAPANQTSGFASFGSCTCNEQGVTYTLDISFFASASGPVTFSGSYVLRDPAGHIILLAGLGDFLNEDAVPAIGFTVDRAGNQLSQFFVTDGTAPLIPDTPRSVDFVSPAVILQFTESCSADPCGSFYSLLDLSRLQA